MASRLGVLEEIAKRREAEAARALAEHRELLDRHLERQRELLTYRAEYASDFAAQGDAGCEAARMKRLAGFLGSLDQAAGQLARQILLSQQDYERLRLVWLSARARVLAVQQLISRRAAKERSRALNAEQVLLDELAQSLPRRRAALGDRD